RDPVRASLVVVEIGVERLLGELVHERGPARVAVLARDHELCACKLRRQVTEACGGCRIARARGAHELLGLLAKLFDVHDDLLPRGPEVRGVGREEDRFGTARSFLTRWAQPCPRTGCALAARPESTRPCRLACVRGTVRRRAAGLPRARARCASARAGLRR